MIFKQTLKYDKYSYQFAHYSDDEKYRYTVGRAWTECLDGYMDYSNTVNFILLNPSTATEIMDDATIRRCVSYAKIWGYGGLIITNIFSYRETNPLLMKVFFDPIGEDNNEQLWLRAHTCGMAVAGWGSHGAFQNRSKIVKNLLKDVNLYCLGRNNDGQPKHPLYLKKNLLPIMYQPKVTN